MEHDPIEDKEYWLEHIDMWYSGWDIDAEIEVPEDLLWDDDFIDCALQTKDFETVLDVLEDYDILNDTNLYEQHMHQELIAYYMTKENVRRWYSMLLDYHRDGRYERTYGTLYKDKGILLKALSLEPIHMSKYLLEYGLYSDSEFIRELQDSLEESDFEYIQEEIKKQKEKVKEKDRKRASRI